MAPFSAFNTWKGGSYEISVENRQFWYRSVGWLFYGQPFLMYESSAHAYPRLHGKFVSIVEKGASLTRLSFFRDGLPCGVVVFNKPVSAVVSKNCDLLFLQYEKQSKVFAIVESLYDHNLYIGREIWNGKTKFEWTDMFDMTPPIVRLIS